MSVTTTNEWAQVQMPGNHSNLFQPQQSPSDPTVGRPMDAAALQQQPNLKCPRCDSSNTKFCYYNNYSLSQPRHFCKACKRYWTRGGTLRNVPVGGGCRKNKRIKKNTNSNTHMNPGSTSAPLPAPHMRSASTTVDPMVYNFHNADLNLPAFLKRSLAEPYDHFRPHNNNMGLCFPISSNTITTPQFPSLLEQSSASTSLVHDYSLLGSSLSSSTAASLLAATLRQPRTTGFSSEWPVYDDLHGNGNVGHREEWNVGQVNPSENVVGDNGLMYWNSSVVGWPDGANCGSSVTPLI